MDGSLLLSTDRVQVCALVFGSVAGVAEGLEAAGMLTDIRFLSCVAPQVDLQVLQTRKGLGAALKLTRKNKKFYYNVRYIYHFKVFPCESKCWCRTETNIFRWTMNQKTVLMMWKHLLQVMNVQ